MENRRFEGQIRHWLEVQLPFLGLYVNASRQDFIQHPDHCLPVGLWRARDCALFPVLPRAPPKILNLACEPVRGFAALRLS